MTRELKDILLRGLTEEELTYYYQPIYNAGTGRVDKAEVLLRVRDGAGGFLDTEEVITAAEELEVARPLDKGAFCHACAVLPEFQAHGVEKLCVNLSAAACEDPELADEVRRILRETGAPPEALCIEVTETAKIQDAALFGRSFRELFALGVEISIDDFGKGYSNFQRILSIPFHTLKLDASLVDSMWANSLAEPLLVCIVDFARANGIAVTAEGVETAEQARRLTEMGCHSLQGYYFSPPLPQEEFFALLDDTELWGLM